MDDALARRYQLLQVVYVRCLSIKCRVPVAQQAIETQHLRGVDIEARKILFGGIGKERELGRGMNGGSRRARSDHNKVHGSRCQSGRDVRIVTRKGLNAGPDGLIPDRRPEIAPLPKPAAHRKRNGKHGVEFSPIRFVDMKWVAIRAGIGILDRIGRRQHQHTGGRQHPRDLGEHLRLHRLRQVLDRFEGDHDVDRAIK